MNLNNRISKHDGSVIVKFIEGSKINNNTEEINLNSNNNNLKSKDSNYQSASLVTEIALAQSNNLNSCKTF